jgi:4-diphosphocytidyl-2C-methyl-D-erythritol kinase
MHVVLVHPGFGLSTGAVFAELRADEWGRQVNDLLAPAQRLRPELADIMAAVARAGGEPRLTGSGPTIFAVTDDPERASAVVDRITADGLRATMTRTRSAAAAIQPIEEEDE